MDGWRGDRAWLRARVEANALVEQAQARAGSGEIRRVLLVAEQHGWPDVALVLHYALFAQATLAGTDARPALGWMEALAAQLDDPLLTALVLGCRAELGFRGDPELAGSADGDLARAVAMVEEGGGSPLDRPSVWIECSQVYHQLDLWELEEEMLGRCAAELTEPWPQETDEIRLTAVRTVAYNRVEAAVQRVCALVERGDREAAAVLADRTLDLARDSRDGLPPAWLGEIDAMRFLLAAVAGRPEPFSFRTVAEGLAEQQWPGYLSCARLGLALRAADDREAVRAADLAEQALTGLDHDLHPPVRMLALALAAARPPVVPANARYADRLVGLRWQSRLHVLGAARSRLDAERIRLENERLSQRAYVDELTGLANRHAYTRFLQRVRQRPDDAGRVVVMMLDVDRFKAVNDGFGHAVGDEVLRRIGALLLARVRPTDLVARLGGDEFIVVLDAVAPDGLDGQRLVDEVAAQLWPELHPELTVTVSAGMATGAPQEVDDVIRTADHRLYQAKRGGRNRLESGRR
jgi:diguanylate cyclase (GGDEF)-like protein